jgi:low affinity Fe/Cu permease
VSESARLDRSERQRDDRPARAEKPSSQGRDKAPAMPPSGRTPEPRQSARRWATRFGVYTATPWAFVIVGAYGLAWAVFGRLDFAGVATLAVWTMTLLIQRAEHRDTQAIHAKLDELLRVQGDARRELTHLDGREPEEIEAFRKQEQKSDSTSDAS